jgi:hypothetical protein
MDPMPKQDLNSVLRFVRRGNFDSVRQLRSVTFEKLYKLGVPRNVRLAPRGKCPYGSDHVDVGSLRDWMSRVSVEDVECVQQIQVIDAAAVARTG